MGFLPARRGRNRNAAGYGAGAAASTWMRAVDALSGDRADRGAGLTSRRTMPERSSCQQQAAPRAHSGALMDRVGFRLVPGAGSVVSLEGASPTPTPNAPTRRRSSSRPAPTVALVWWAGDE